MQFIRFIIYVTKWVINIMWIHIRRKTLGNKIIDVNKLKKFQKSKRKMKADRIG